MARTLAAVVAAFTALLTVGLSGALGADAPISATSWRAILVGPTLQGGATTLLESNGRGTVNVTVAGAAAGESVSASVVEAQCGHEGATFASFPLPVDASGIARGKLALTPPQVTAYVAARRARMLFSVRVATPGSAACGNQVGAPSVGTIRRADTKAGLYAYDLREPLVSGLDPAVAKSVNDQLSATNRATIDEFVAAAKEAGGENSARQSFVVSLALPSLLSLVEHYVPEIAGAPHGDEQFFTFTFDLATGHRILLTELFRADRDWLTALSNAAIARLQPTLGNFSSAVAGPIATSFDAWRLAPGGLQITFARAQGFSVPITTITIPWSSLRSVLDPASPVARLFPKS